MKKTILFAALFSLIFGITSCQKGEDATVTKYFEAMKHNDKDTMSAMAVEPKNLEYKAFKIIKISEPEVIELELPGMEQHLVDLKKQRKEQIDIATEKKFAVEDLQDELEETRRRTKKAELKKQIEEAEVAAEEEKQKVLQVMLQITKLEKEISAEKNLITSSTGVDENFKLYTGETHISKVNVNVTLINDEVKEYIFVLRKYVLKLQDRDRSGRMVITKIATVEEFEQEKQKMEEEKKTETEEVTEEEPAAETSDASS